MAEKNTPPPRTPASRTGGGRRRAALRIGVPLPLDCRGTKPRDYNLPWWCMRVRAWTTVTIGLPLGCLWTACGRPFGSECLYRWIAAGPSPGVTVVVYAGGVCDAEPKPRDYRGGVCGCVRGLPLPLVYRWVACGLPAGGPSDRSAFTAGLPRD